MDNKDNTLLKQAEELGIIDLGFTQQMIEMIKEKEKQKVIEEHKAAITSVIKGKKTLHVTTVYDATKKDNRRQISSVTLEGLHQKIYEEYLKNEKSFSAYYYEYLQECDETRRVKANTVSRMDDAFKQLFGSLSNIPLQRLTEDDVTDFIEGMAAKGISLSAFENAKGYLKKFLYWAKRHKLISFSIEDAFNVAQVNPGKQCYKRKRHDEDEVFSDEEMEILVNYLINKKEDRRALAILLMLVTGLRLGEIVALKGQSLTDCSIKMYFSEHRYRRDTISKEAPQYDENGKRKRKKGTYLYIVEGDAKTDEGIRQVIVPKQAQWILHELKKDRTDEDYVVNYIGKERQTSEALSSWYYKQLKKLGLKHKRTHCIRKTYASILLDNHADNNFTKAQVGHTDIKTTEQYYHRNRKKVEKKEAILTEMQEFNVFDIGQTEVKQEVI